MKVRSTRGFTLVEIMIVVAIIGILIAIAVPGFIRARNLSRGRAVQNDLTKIDAALQQYALDFDIDTSDGAPGPDAVTSLQDLVDEGYFRTLITPPVDGYVYELPAQWSDYPFTTLCDAQTADYQPYFRHPEAADCSGVAQ